MGWGALIFLVTQLSLFSLFCASLPEAALAKSRTGGGRILVKAETLKKSPSASADAGMKTVIAAGLPQYLGRARNYDAIFAELSAAGVTVFLADGQCRQLPEPASLGYEADFYPAENISDPATKKAYGAMKRHRVKLLVPADILYPRGKDLPPLAEDPLRRLIKTYGAEAIFGVYAYDEPAKHGHFRQMDRACEAVYKRVKELNSALPVVMVHAPLVDGRSPGDVQYLKQVLQLSQFADVVGFDIYPIPIHVAKLVDPFSPSREAATAGAAAPGLDPATGLFTDYRAALTAYCRFLKRNLPGKAYIMVLQSFSYKDQGFDPVLAHLYGDRRPTVTELKTMVKVARKEGVGCIAWWGQGMLAGDLREVRLYWQEVLQASAPEKSK